MRAVVLALLLAGCASIPDPMQIDASYCPKDLIEPEQYRPSALAGRAVPARSYQAIMDANRECRTHLGQAAVTNYRIAAQAKEEIRSAQWNWFFGGALSVLTVALAILL